VNALNQPHLRSFIQQLAANIRNYYDLKEGLIPLHAPCFNDKEKQKVVATIDSTFVSSVGEEVQRFEQQVADFVGAPYGVALVNGTAGLMLALRLVGVQQNDLVLTQSLTFVATANAITQLCATPLFIDVDRQTLGMSAQALQDYLATQTQIKAGQCYHKATGQRIAACMPMHTLGMPCEIEQIVTICQAYQIPVVEDAAESLGSKVNGRHTGTWGQVGVFSFNGNKILTTGGGGVLVTAQKTLAQQAKHLSTTAKQPHPWAFEHDAIGYNLRLPNLNAALGVAQMQKLSTFLHQKQQLHKNYQIWIQKKAANLPKSPAPLQNLEILKAPKGTEPNYWLNGLLLPDRQNRDFWLETLNQLQIQARPLWKPLHQQAIYQAAPHQELTNTDWLAERIINLPSGIPCHKFFKKSE